MAWQIAARILRGRATGAKLIVVGLFMIFAAGGLDIASHYLTGEGSIAAWALIGLGAVTVGVGLGSYISAEKKGKASPVDVEAAGEDGDEEDR